MRRKRARARPDPGRRTSDDGDGFAHGWIPCGVGTIGSKILSAIRMRCNDLLVRNSGGVPMQRAGGVDSILTRPPRTRLTAMTDRNPETGDDAVTDVGAPFEVETAVINGATFHRIQERA